MIKISNTIKENTFYFAIIGYTLTVVSIGCYYFGINTKGYEIIISTLDFLIFPIWFIMIVYIRDNQLSKNDKNNYSDILDFSKYVAKKPIWLTTITVITIIYSSIAFFYWTFSGSPDGIPSIENNEYIVRNHTQITIVTKEKFDELTRMKNIGNTSHLLFFYVIAIWILYKRKI